jgi:hypothetical protein
VFFSDRVRFGAQNTNASIGQPSQYRPDNITRLLCNLDIYKAAQLLEGTFEIRESNLLKEEIRKLSFCGT